MSSHTLTPPRFEPMPLARLHAPFEHPDWIFELKYGGWRAMAYLDRGACRLVSRKRNTFKHFLDLCSAIAAAIPGCAVLDGEIACLDSEGRPQFYELMRRRTVPTYCAFDVLWLSGRDVRDKPLLERKAILKRLVSPPLLYVDHVQARGVNLFNAACERIWKASSRSWQTGAMSPALKLG